jgi:RNA polymerase sigma-32 factor
MMKNANTTVVKFIPDSSLTAYIRQVHAIPMLTLEEENDLTEKLWKKIDFAAAQRLVMAHLRLVVKIAQNFKSYDLPMQDMISEGNIGLMKAVQKFSPEVGCRLATYASWWIRAAIQEYILNSWSMLKISTKTMKEKLFYKLRQTKDCIMKVMHGCDEDVNLTNLQTISLNAPQSSQNNAELIDTIESDETCHAEKIIAQDEKERHKILLQNGIENLNEREKDILYRRRLKNVPDKLCEIAKSYGISSERVRQIEDKIILKLRSFAFAG